MHSHTLQRWPHSSSLPQLTPQTSALSAAEWSVTITHLCCEHRCIRERCPKIADSMHPTRQALTASVFVLMPPEVAHSRDAAGTVQAYYWPTVSFGLVHPQKYMSEHLMRRGREGPRLHRLLQHRSLYDLRIPLELAVQAVHHADANPSNDAQRTV